MTRYLFILLSIFISIPQVHAQSSLAKNVDLYEMLEISLSGGSFSTTNLKNDSLKHSDVVICINSIVEKHSLINNSTSVNLKNLKIDFLTKEDIFLKYVKNYVLITKIVCRKKNVKICLDLVNIENQLREKKLESQCSKLIKIRDGYLKLIK
ncbi:MAG: hypothetical protein EBR30_10145 [Cytophagia bacterium]|nr:hypothetical protein [Cytophagia bacterium]